MRTLTATLMLLCFVSSANAGGSINLDFPLDSAQHTYVILGCTLTPGWVDFPGPSAQGKLSPTYQGNTANWWEQLDGSFPVYVAWKTEVQGGPNDGMVSFNPPKLLKEVVPLFETPGPYAGWTWALDYYLDPGTPAIDEEDDSSNLYYNCGSRIEAPTNNSWPISSNNNIHVKDIFGGAMEGTTVLLRMNNSGGPAGHLILMFGWDHPGTYKEATTDVIGNYTPGQTVNVKQRFVATNGSEAFCNLPTLITNFSTPDFLPASPGFVDTSDLVALVPLLSPSTPVNWGFSGHAGVLGSGHNFKFNINPFGTSLNTIDSYDLSTMAWYLGDYCQASKAGERNQADAILQWFGLARTGRFVPIDSQGTLIPEWDLVDAAQRARGLADPFGYLARVNASRGVTWGQVKTRYR